MMREVMPNSHRNNLDVTAVLWKHGTKGRFLLETSYINLGKENLNFFNERKLNFCSYSSLGQCENILPLTPSLHTYGEITALQCMCSV